MRILPLTLAALLASPLAATTISGAGIYNYAGATSTGAVPLNTVAGNFRFTGSENGKPLDVLGFCVDLANSIGVGFGYQAGVNYTYATAKFTHDAFGNALTPSTVKAAKGLAALGFAKAQGGFADDVAAIQIALWHTVYPSTVFTSSNSNVNSLVTHYMNIAPSLTGSARYITSLDNPTRQGMLISAPEPASWAMLIAGFGLMGALARRRRRLLRPA